MSAAERTKERSNLLQHWEGRVLGLSSATSRKVLSDRPALKPDWGKPTVRPVKFAPALPLHMRRQWSALAGPQLLKPLAPVAAQRLVAGYALAEQQTLDAVDVAYALVRQCLALMRRRSSSSGVGTRSIAQTRGSP